MKRMEIIQKVASIVGPGHQVDLKNPDVYILVEIYTVSQFGPASHALLYLTRTEHLRHQCSAQRLRGTEEIQPG
jgi:hypothetical protein